MISVQCLAQANRPIRLHRSKQHCRCAHLTWRSSGWVSGIMETFIKNANLMRELGKEWKQKRAYTIILQIRAKAENLEDGTELTNAIKTITTGAGAGSSACMVGGLVVSILVPGAPVIGILGGGGMLIGSVCGVMSGSSTAFAGVLEKRFATAMHDLRQADEELLKVLLEQLRDAGFSFRAPSLEASSSLDASSLASFLSRCGLWSAMFITKALPTVASGLILGGMGLPILFDGYSCWNSARRLVSGKNSDSAAEFLEFAKLLEKNSEDLLEDLEHTLMEQYMDEKLTEIA